MKYSLQINFVSSIAKFLGTIRGFVIFYFPDRIMKISVH